MIKNFDMLIKRAQDNKTMRLVVAAAQDEDVLKAVCQAAGEGIVEPVLVGDVDAIKAIAKDNNLNVDQYELISAESLEESASISVKLVSEKKADFLMKGLIDTSILLKAVLNKEIGLRTDRQLSHVMVYDVPAYHKLLVTTDGGMNISPSLEEKKVILKNGLQVADALGIEKVKVACLAAKEKVNPKMPVTVDARALQEMGEHGEFGDKAVVEGPLAFDLAISADAARVKGFTSEVAGDADMLMMPNIEVGNGIGKSFTYFGKAKSAGIIMGAKAPVVLVSRADSAEDKLYSIALGSVIAQQA